MRSIAGGLKNIKISLFHDIDINRFWRLEGCQQELTVVVNLHTKANCDLASRIANVPLSRRVQLVCQGVERVGLKIGNIYSHSTNEVVIVYGVMVKNSNIELRAWVEHVEDKGSLGPRHPFWVQIIVNDVGLAPNILKNKASKGIGEVAGETTGVKIWQSCA